MPRVQLVEATGGFESGKEETFARWMTYPGSLCASASTAQISTSLALYGTTLGYDGANIELTPRSAGKYLSYASKDTATGVERGLKHHVISLGPGKWAITAGPRVAPDDHLRAVAANTMLTPTPRRTNSHLVTTVSDSRTLKRHQKWSEQTKIDLAASAQRCREQEAEITISGSAVYPCDISAASRSHPHLRVLL